MAPKNKNFKYLTKHTLKPHDLRGGTVSLLIAGSNTKDDGWFVGVVNVGPQYTLTNASWAGATSFWSTWAAALRTAK